MFAPSHGSRAGVPHFVLLLTDGQANRMMSQTLPEATLLRDSGATIITIGITQNIDAQQLNAIATSALHTFFLKDFSQLGNIRNDVVKLMCDGAASGGATGGPPGEGIVTRRPNYSLGNS